MVAVFAFLQSRQPIVTDNHHKRVVSVVAIALGLILSVRTDGQQVLQRRLQVVIVAVSQFDDKEWQNARLELSIKQSSRDIQEFFREYFPTAKVTLLETHQQTTAKSIREFFSVDGDFRKLANRTATVLFIISHGEPHTGPVPPLTNDLWVVGSETHPGDAREGWVSVAKDVVGQIDDLDPGSVVFLFLDTCYAGSLQSLEMRVHADFAETYGIRMMVMASSLPKERSYRATFSEAVVDRWKEPSTGEACTYPSHAPESLRKYMVKRLEPPPLSVFEANPQTVIPFMGDFCLESFDKDHGLLILFNASSEGVAAVINDHRNAPVTVQTMHVVPHMLRRDKYRLEVFAPSNNTPLIDKPLDLNLEPVDFEVLGAANAAKLGTGYLKAASYAAAAGLSKDQEATFEKRAFSSFSAAGRWPLAQNILLKLNQSEPHNEGLIQAAVLADPRLDFAYEDHASQKQEAEWRLENDMSSSSFAEVEKLAGRFGQAGGLYSRSITSSLSAKELEELGKQAYYAYGASHQAKKAQALRVRYKLPVDADCPRCVEKETAAAKEESHFVIRALRFIGPSDFSLRSGKEFSTLCIVRSLSTLAPSAMGKHPGPIVNSHEN